MRFRMLAVLTLAVAAMTLPGAAPPAQAQQRTILRIATLAPSGTVIVKGFHEWDALLRKETNGQVGLRIYAGGSAGDEKVIVRKMRVGQLDGAAVTVTGLGLIARPTLVLAAPGVILDYREIDLVRKEMAGQFNKMFEDAGYDLLGWGDAGRTRLFSEKDIQKPSDLKTARPWVWTDNPVMVEFMRTVGANGVPLGVPEVYPMLQTGMIDTVVASALTAIGLQWFTHLKYMSSETSGVIIGALIMRKDKMNALPKHVQDLIRQTAKTGAAELQKARGLDDRAYTALLQHGMKLSNVKPYEKQWEDAFRKTTKNMVGRLYSQKLLDQVLSIVAKVRTKYPVR